MDIESMPLQDLQVIKSQLEEEMDKLSTSFGQLRTAGTKYSASRAALDNLSEGEVLVPLTSSLYVPGTVVDSNNVLVEVGAGYYVNKQKQQAKEFCERKIKMLRENMDKVSNLITQRKRTLEAVVQNIQKKSSQS